MRLSFSSPNQNVYRVFKSRCRCSGFFVVIHPASKCMTCTFVLTGCFYSSCVMSVSFSSSAGFPDHQFRLHQTHFPSILEFPLPDNPKQQFGGCRSQFLLRMGRSSSAARGMSAPDRIVIPRHRDILGHGKPPHSARGSPRWQPDRCTPPPPQTDDCRDLCHLPDPLKRMGLAVLRCRTRSPIRDPYVPLLFLQCRTYPL